jgi:hypothetical protein
LEKCCNRRMIMHGANNIKFFLVYSDIVYYLTMANFGRNNCQQISYIYIRTHARTHTHIIHILSFDRLRFFSITFITTVWMKLKSQYANTINAAIQTTGSVYICTAFREDYILWCYTLHNFLQPLVTSFSLRPNTIFSTLFSDTFGSCSSFKKRRSVVSRQNNR